MREQSKDQLEKHSVRKLQRYLPCIIALSSIEIFVLILHTFNVNLIKHFGISPISNFLCPKVAFIVYFQCTLFLTLGNPEHG